MITVHHLSKAYGADEILRDVSFSLVRGERVGLIGPNGSGKSTLLKLITGQLRPDRGHVRCEPGVQIGYLAQEVADWHAKTIAECLATAQAPLVAAEHALEAASTALAASHDLHADLARYADALATFEALGGYEQPARVAAIFAGLGLGALATDHLVGALSGGQRTRLGLALLLVRAPDLLLLDEPSNHLDQAALEWLEAFLLSYRGTVLIVSHDRELLNRTVSRILFLDPQRRSVTSYPGNYQAFVAARSAEQARHAENYRRQREYVAEVQTDIARLKGRANQLEGARTPANDPDMKWVLGGSQSAARSSARMAKAREQKLARYLQSEERVEKPRQEWSVKLDFGQPPPGGQALLRIDDLAFGYAETALFSGLSLEVAYSERIALIGPNGSGKSTLLKLIAGHLHPKRGQIRLGSGARVGYLSQDQLDALDPQASLLDTILAERPLEASAARSFLHFFLFSGDAVFRRIAECSPGERTRLQLARLMLRGCNLLLLDEPLNHLDIDGREHLAQALAHYHGAIILVAHDRAFLAEFGGRTLNLG